MKRANDAEGERFPQGAANGRGGRRWCMQGKRKETGIGVGVSEPVRTAKATLLICIVW